MDPPILNPDVPTAASAEPGCSMPKGQAQSTTIWLKRQFPSDGFGTASVFETFGNHCIALGMPLEMLMVEERSRDGSGATIWIRLPASERAAYREFGQAPESALPKRAILLIGHNGEFEKLFDDAEDDDQLVQPRRDRHLPRCQVDRRPARRGRSPLRDR